MLARVTAGSTMSPSSSFRARAYAVCRSCGVAPSLVASRSRCCARDRRSWASAEKSLRRLRIASDSAISNAATYSPTASRYSSWAVRSPRMSSTLSGRSQSAWLLALWKPDRQRIAHIGHQREVQQLGDVDLVVQPAASVRSCRSSTLVISRLYAASLLRARPDASASATLVCCLMRYRSSRRCARRSLAAATARTPPPITPPSGKISHQKFPAK